MSPTRRAAAWLAALPLLAACAADAASTARGDSAAPVVLAPADTAGTAPDTTLATRAAPAALPIVLPAPPATPLAGRAATLGDLAVFVPRTTRWLVARRADSLRLAVDIGRLDDALAPSDSSALVAMLAATSPVQPGLAVVVHAWRTADSAVVASLGVQGRRLVATLALAQPAPRWAIVEIVPPAGVAPAFAAGAVRAPRPPRCDGGDVDRIDATIARLLDGARRTDGASATLTPRDTARGDATLGSAIGGCFGAFRAVVVRRPAIATPDVVEKAWLVRPDGRARPVRLRDLSYPLHDLLGTLDLDGDGTDELLVRSTRPAMETIAALRMSDSVTFTRVVNGWTVERR